MVHALPVLHGLRKRYPEARIDWLIAKSLHELIDGHPDLDEVVLFDRHLYGQLGRRWHASKAFVQFVQALRRRRYDLVIDLQGLFRTGFLSRATGARVRLGFADAREGAALFYNYRLRSSDPDTHAVDRNYLVAKSLGFDNQPIEFQFPVCVEAKARAKRLLESNRGPGSKRFVAIVPGARWETKAWLPERFAALIDALEKEMGLQCVLIGAGDDQSVCEAIHRTCRSQPLNLAGKTSLKELTAILAACDVALCNDSGTAHIAAALGRPVVCICGPTNPARTGPYGQPEGVVRLDINCSPCYLRRLSQCPHEHRCMADLSVEKVKIAVLNALRQSSESPLA